MSERGEDMVQRKGDISAEKIPKKMTMKQGTTKGIGKVNVTPEMHFQTPRIEIPAEGQLFDKQHASYKDMYPYPYRLSYIDRVDIDVRIKQWKPSQSGKSGGFSSVPILEKTISASQLSTKYNADGLWAFEEILYMPPGKYRIDAKAKLNETAHTPWCSAANFFLGEKEVSKDEFKIPQALTQAIRTDLMPTKLYIKVANGECELWLKIKNLGQYWFRKKLGWEVYRNGSHEGTWGTDHKRDIGPGAEMEIRLAYPAALPISLFGMNNWRVKLIPEGGDQNENNNEIGPVSLRCKKPSSELKSLKRKETIQGLDKDVIKPVLLLLAVKTRPLSRDNPIALKFRHDVRQKKYKYEFEKWDEKRKRWVKTSEPRMIRSQTSKGADVVMTTAYFRFKTPGKYRWGTAGLPPQKRQEIVVGEIAAKRVTATISPKQVSATGKEPGKVSPPTKKTPQEKKKTKSVRKKLGDTKKKMPVKFDKPEFKNLDTGQSFPSGSTILFNLKLNPTFKNYKVKYEVYQNECKGQPFKVSTHNNFGKLSAGRYCVRAAYLGGKKMNWSKGIPFVVKEKKRVPITPEKKSSHRKKLMTQ